jgi:hypothetical protein
LNEIAPPRQLRRSAFSLDMKQVSLITVFIIAMAFGNWRLASTEGRSDDWITVHACDVSLQVPQSLKRNRNEGIDSCTAEFENREMFLLLDYGTWGGEAKKTANTLDFAEESFIVDGKTGVFATYVIYPINQREPSYLAHLYVVLKAAEGPYGRPTSSFMATLTGRSPKDMAIARRIFSSVRFTPATPNKSGMKDEVKHRFLRSRQSLD